MCADAQPEDLTPIGKKRCAQTIRAQPQERKRCAPVAREFDDSARESRQVGGLPLQT